MSYFQNEFCTPKSAAIRRHSFIISISFPAFLSLRKTRQIIEYDLLKL